MLPAERKHKTLDVLRAEGKVGVADLARRFEVTRETIRRDLEKLEADGWLERTHGGAVAIVERAEDLPYLTREAVNLGAKQRIAHKAARLIGEGQTLMLDSSSTVCEILAGLADRRDLQLISNSMRVAALGTEAEHRVITVGGELRQRSMAFVGGLAEESLARFQADWALIGCKALHRESGVMESNLDEAQIKRIMIGHARRTALLVDQTKFDRQAMVRIAALASIDVMITDEAPDEAWQALLVERGVELVY